MQLSTFRMDDGTGKVYNSAYVKESVVFGKLAHKLKSQSLKLSRITLIQNGGVILKINIVKRNTLKYVNEISKMR